MQFRAQSRTSPAAARARGGSLALLSPKGGSWKKGLASFTTGAGWWWGGGQRGPSLPSFLSKSALPAGTRALPRGEALGPAWLRASCRSHLLGRPIHPFPVREEGEGCQVVPSLCRAQGVQLTEEKPPPASCSQSPQPQRNPGRGSHDRGLVRASHQTDPAPSCPSLLLLLLLTFQVFYLCGAFLFVCLFCFPHPRAPAPPAWKQI